MALDLESSRHFPGAVAFGNGGMADGTRCVPATFKANRVALGAGAQFSGRTCRMPDVADMTSGMNLVTVKIDAAGTIGAKFKVDH